VNREKLHSMIDLVLDLRESMLPQAPKEAMSHFRSAKRESLLGVKALVEHALDRVEAEEKKAAAEVEGPKVIPVE